uniref:Uncharacterized protein n=1 Tax=Arion vulgaris TaxID=1028688 RepID=A0A0B6YRK6_9EUPU
MPFYCYSVHSLKDTWHWVPPEVDMREKYYSLQRRDQEVISRKYTTNSMNIFASNRTVSQTCLCGMNKQTVEHILQDSLTVQSE